MPERPDIKKCIDVNATKSAWIDGNEYPFAGHESIQTDGGAVDFTDPGALKAEGIDFTSALTAGYADQLRYKEDVEEY